MDVHAQMQISALYKLIIILFGSAHWLGCLFYFLSNVQRHSEQEAYTTFSVLMSRNQVGFNLTTTGAAEQYLVAIFKGFNIISAQNYESVVPQTYPEMIFSILCVPLQIYIAAYVLGTINNYLVKKDARREADRRALQQLEEYCAQRRLPPALTVRLKNHVLFQQTKQRSDDVGLHRLLPRGLQMKLGLVLYETDVVKRNAHLFRGCNQQFIANFLVELREARGAARGAARVLRGLPRAATGSGAGLRRLPTARRRNPNPNPNPNPAAQVHLMPGEVLVKQGDNSSQLLFCTRGILELQARRPRNEPEARV